MRRVAIVAMIAACVVLAAPLYGQSYPQNPYPQNGPNNVPGEIPAGTSLSIRANEAINSDQARPGATFPAEIAQDVMGPNGQVLVPRGSPAQLEVVNTGSSKLGGNNMALALRSVTVNGRTYQVLSNTSAGGAGGTGIGVNKRTGEYVGGGAVLGTLIGAVAGGGKGAAIGAILGGGGGAAAQVLTKGKSINVPAESVLTFRLDQPIQLR